MTLPNLASATLLANKIELLQQMDDGIDAATITSIEIRLDTDKKIVYSEGILRLILIDGNAEAEVGSIAEWPLLAATDFVAELANLITDQREDLQSAFDTIAYDEAP